jgi:hypothetical protein
MPRLTPHQRTGKDLTSSGLTMPAPSAGPGWPPTRALYIRKKMFFVSGDRRQPQGALTMIMKLPVSAEMARDLKFMPESRGWSSQHDWVIAGFGSEDDIRAEISTPKAWMAQSDCAVVPQTFACVVRGEA